MPDTERFRLWEAMLRQSDAVLVQLVAIAVVAVIGWEFTRKLNEPWRGRLRLVYLVSAGGALATMIAGAVEGLTFGRTLAAATAAVVAHTVWVYLRRRKAGPIEAKGQ